MVDSRFPRVRLNITAGAELADDSYLEGAESDSLDANADTYV
jgi:hypothetical protein